MYGPWLCRHTARPWCFGRVGIQVGHGIPSSEMQCPECIKIQTPFRPLPQANRTHENWRCNKVPGCQPHGYRFLEDTHRKYLQEAQQHAQDLKMQPQVLWWGLKSKHLLQHSPLELWILLVCLDQAQEVSDSEIRDKSKNSCLVHNKPKQEHQQPAIKSQASPVEISRFQAFQNSTDTERWYNVSLLYVQGSMLLLLLWLLYSGFGCIFLYRL